MSHQWVKNGNRVSTEYMDGVKEFLNVARQTLNTNGLTLCPCSNCLNSRLHDIGVIAAHLINIGIDKSYTQWVYHGEDEVNEEDTGCDDFVDEEASGLRAGLEDVIEHESNELPPFQPTEKLPDTSPVVRNDVEPESLSYEAVLAIRNANVPADDLIDVDDGYEDLGRIFLNNESILDSETDHDSTDPDHNSDDDDSFA
ncbi:hypothetical protein E3N88_10228 [Mikania micrantha]|uniref:Transposase-associated domain-containing protein n=1 Tax=Mikania micrantha TaxID=192012 RepID=A0A5N6PCB5_9ASTR|nr:hypothetical protein E3N88_10228 [Mikania micrantha]